MWELDCWTLGYDSDANAPCPPRTEPVPTVPIIMKEPAMDGDAWTGLPALYVQRAMTSVVGPATLPTPVCVALRRN